MGLTLQLLCLWVGGLDRMLWYRFKLRIAEKIYLIRMDKAWPFTRISHIDTHFTPHAGAAIKIRSIVSPNPGKLVEKAKK